MGKKINRGFIYLTDAKKDMNNVAGNNVYQKLERLMKINKNASSVKIYSEDSVLQDRLSVPDDQAD
jgi:acyl-CoA synthetase (AMP-forming)/AMP-acid ligase II